MPIKNPLEIKRAQPEEQQEQEYREPSKTDKLLHVLETFKPVFNEHDDNEVWNQIHDSLRGKNFSSIGKFRNILVGEMESKNWRERNNVMILRTHLDAMVDLINAWQEKK